MKFREEYVVELLETIFDVPVRVLMQPFAFFSEFHLELRAMLLQSPYPSIETLENELLTIPSNRIFYLKSALGYINIFLRIAEPDTSKILHIGPFLEEDFSQSNLSRMMREGGISDKQNKWLSSYFNSLSIISQQRMLRVLSVILNQEIPDFKNDNIIFHNFEPLKPLDLQNYIDYEQQFANKYHDKLLQTHQIFFRALQLGDFKTVFAILPQYLSESQSVQKATLYSYKQMLHDLNAECRMTLFSTPISAYNIHQVWNKCSMRIQSEMRQERLNILAEWMMHEYALLYRTYGYKNYSPIIRKVIEHIHYNIDRPISLQEVAEEFGRNKTTLSRQFKEEVEENFSQYTQRIKIETSLEKVLQAQETIQEIALSVGFEDQAYFNRIFHKFMGCSPTDYRLNWHSSVK